LWLPLFLYAFPLGKWEREKIFKISPDEFYTIALNGMVQHGET